VGTFSSQDIVYEPRRLRSPGGVTSPAGRRLKEERTTGLFAVPVGAGNPITVSLFVSNPATQAESAELRVRMAADGELATVFFRIVTVPAGEVRKIDLGDLAGETIEVSLSPPSAVLVPSVSVWEYFPADGGIIVHAAKYPGDFVIL